MQVAELVGRAVAALGAGRAFGVVGSGNFAVTNALRAAGVPFTAARHEGGAATMADAWARTSGRVGVLTLHQGCGLTNAVTGVAEAAKSRTPLLVLAADTAGSAVRSNFRIDQDALVRSVGAVPERVHSPASAVPDVLRAWRTARDTRRTVVLNLPLDVQAAPAPEDALAQLRDPGPPVPARPGEAAVEALAARVAAARRPLLLAGRGARGAGPLLRELAERTGALLATTAVAKGLFEGDPFDLGISGGFASPLAAELITGADLVVAWGASLTAWTTRHGRLLGEDAVVVQVDADVDALGANRPVDLGVLGDVAATARALLAGLPQGAPPRGGSTGYRSPELAARIAAEGRWTRVPTEDSSTPTTIDPRGLSREVDARLPRERVVAVDSGNFMGYPSAYWSVPDERGFCFTQAFQSVGLGLATLVGAALAAPDRLPVLGTGDGGLLMAAAELETLVRLRLGAVVVVYDDAAYGAEVHHFGPDADHGAVVFPDTDIAAWARGAGAAAATVRSTADLGALDAWLAGPREGPIVLDCKISSDGGAWWLAEAFRGH
ncbi:thiamine pyrophosphate-binding protein [Quadrisphaera sp. DSM 44207]|uniref:thiamine pyrophosphate-binding protein n=1 Tax=Quadrisphaera sp. DSM 44207 TaxID=1881057 RepID=UPI000885C923|nr:thiamine pyrophosphate-binding protein [Quadrisphaera sp. DSM 44207]SDQ36418.1 Acetolactate synthase large subunit [Quadrisphaera sp. DSM 44207]